MGECPNSLTKKEIKMNKESFDWMVQKSKKMVTHWPEMVLTNLKLKQDFYSNGLVHSGSEVINPHRCDEEMRERYRI
jgi:hypothetical protein